MRGCLTKQPESWTINGFSLFYKNAILIYDEPITFRINNKPVEVTANQSKVIRKAIEKLFKTRKLTEIDLLVQELDAFYEGTN